MNAPQTSNPVRLHLKQIPEDVISSMFCIFTYRPERKWVAKSWRILGRAGLTTYRTSSEFNAVLGRLALLAFIYRRWAEYAYQDDCGVEDQVGEWHELLPFVRNPGPPGFPKSWNEPAEESCEGDGNYLRMMELMAREHEAVFDALIHAYGDRADYGLAVDLRRACGRPNKYPAYEEPIAEWKTGQQMWDEVGMTPGEMSSVYHLEGRFELGCWLPE